jgi:hypothetical protein
MSKAQRTGKARPERKLAQHLYPATRRGGRDSVSKTLDDLTEDWAAMKVPPEDTGLPMAVWITENDGYPHDVRVKVSKLHGGGGSWRHDSVSVGVRPQPHEIVPGSLPAADFALVRQWIELNRQTILEFWDGKLTPRQVQAQLQKLP